MKKPAAVVLVIGAAILAVAVPMGCAIYLARIEARESQENQALIYAKDALYLSDKATEQIAGGIKKLKSAETSDPCSSAALELIRSLDLEASFVQAFGHVSGERMICSSLGNHG